MLEAAEVELCNNLPGSRWNLQSLGSLDHLPAEAVLKYNAHDLT